MESQVQFIATARLDPGAEATAQGILGRVCEVSNNFDERLVMVRFNDHETYALRSEIVAIKSVTSPDVALPSLSDAQLAALSVDDFAVAVFGASDAEALQAAIDAENATRAAKKEAERIAEEAKKAEDARLAAIAAQEAAARAAAEADKIAAARLASQQAAAEAMKAMVAAEVERILASKTGV